MKGYRSVELVKLEIYWGYIPKCVTAGILDLLFNGTNPFAW